MGAKERRPHGRDNGFLAASEGLASFLHEADGQAPEDHETHAGDHRRLDAASRRRRMRACIDGTRNYPYPSTAEALYQEEGPRADASAPGPPAADFRAGVMWRELVRQSAIEHGVGSALRLSDSARLCIDGTRGDRRSARCRDFE